MGCCVMDININYKETNIYSYIMHLSNNNIKMLGYVVGCID